MQIHEVTQGSAEWHALRSKHFTASEAPALMGASPYLTRTELLAKKASGLPDIEPDEHKAALFAAGHAAEAAYRPYAEETVGDDLYPVTGTVEVEGIPLLASFDGLTLDNLTGYEHKLWSQKIVAQLDATGEPGPAYYWQLEQQLLVSGGKRIRFVTSDGTADKARSVWYESKPERRAALLAAWKQFAADLASYVPDAPRAAPVVAAPQETLPAVSVRVDGQLAIVSNLPAYGAILRNFIERIPEEPATDQEFADTEAACNRLKRVEEELESAEDLALAQLTDVNTMRQLVKQYRELARTTRLQREKLVALRKDQIRAEIVAAGQKAMAGHIAALNARLGENYMPHVLADFAGAIKGKRTVDSLHDAVNSELARAKIAASEIANRIHANVKTLEASGLVVPDAATLVLKAPDDLAAIIATRKAAEQQRLEAERERIRQEEAARADREARAKLAAEQRAAQAEIAQAAQTGTLAAPVAADLGTLVQEKHAEAVAGLDAQQVIGTAQRAAAGTPVARTSVPTLRIGTIKERLQHMSVTAEDLRALGFEPAGRERAATLYHEDDFPEICEAIAAQALAAKAEFLKSRAAVAA